MICDECGCTMDHYFDLAEYRCPECGNVYDLMVDWDHDDDFTEDQPGCGCPFCMCSNSTIAGETCNACLAGSHQG